MTLHSIRLLRTALLSLGLAVTMATAPVAWAQTTVTIAQGVDPDVLDPGHDTLITSVSTMLNIYDTLVQRTGEGDLVPALATEWRFPEPTVMEIDLRQDVTFHDGSPFTAADVVFTLNRYVREENPLSIRPQIAGIIDSADAIDDYTVRINMPTPQATIVANLARYPILSASAFEAMGEDAYGQAPVGTGPFAFAQWDRNEQIVLESYDDHWRGLADIDRLVIRPIPEDFIRFAALQAGEVDIIGNIAPERVPEVEADPDLRVEAVRSVRNMFVGMNPNVPPFDDVRVRRAMNHAVNVPALVEAILGGHGYPNASPCSGAIFGYDPSIEPYAYDPEQARELLAEAGYPDGFTVTMWGPNGRYLKDREMQEAIAGQLSAIGVRVEHHMPEWSEFIQHFLAGDIEGMYFIGTGNPILDCEATMGYRFDSRRGGDFYNRPELDALIDQQIQELDPERREEIFAEIQAMIFEDAPWIFLYDQEDLYGVNNRIEWSARSDEMIWAYDIQLAD